MNSKILALILISVLTAIIHAALYISEFGERFEPLALDLWFNIRGAIVAPEEVAIIAIDEQSYIELEVPLNGTWPRSLHARLLRKLESLGAKRVAFDVLFLDEGPDPSVDTDLADAFGALPTVLGTESALRQVGGLGGSYVLEELLAPLDIFVDNAEQLALVGLPEDYGVIRRFNTTRTEITQDIPSLGLGGSGLDPSKIEMPGERDFIKYYGPARSIFTLSYYQVLEEASELPRELIDGKAIYVGLSLRTDAGPAQKDVFRSPFYGEHIFGLEVHATTAANLMQQDWIKRFPLWIEVLILSILAIAMSVIFLFKSPHIGALALLGYLAVWSLTSYFMFLGGVFVPGTILAVIILPLLYLGCTVYDYTIARAEAQQIQGAFELYLSPEMAKEMSRNKDALKLGGEKVWATAVFTDIASFTSITEKMPAEQVSAMLNSYFTEVLDVVFENNGTLIKFIGDAAFVLWGAPIKTDNHAELAVKTALLMDQEVKKFNDSERFPHLHTRIGIHTGPMVVGNLGSERRFDYTAIGDSVNLAARTEGLNKYFGTTVLFTGSTLKESGDSLDSLEMGAVLVVGKREPVDLHTILDNLHSKVEKRWLEALDDFKHKRFDDAQEAYEEIMEREERLKIACELYLKQIEMHRAETPENSWRGEIVFKSK